MIAAAGLTAALSGGTLRSVRWLGAWVAISLVAFLVVAPWGGGTLAAPGDGPAPEALVIVLGLQLVVAVAVSIAVLTRRSRQHVPPAHR